MTRPLFSRSRLTRFALPAHMVATVLLALGGALAAGSAAADDHGYGRGDDSGYRNGDGGGYGDSRGEGWRSDARIGCESSNGRYKLCQVAIRGNVRLVREHSRADCVEGQSWGWSQAGIWVDRGCRGEFTYTPRTAGGYGGGRDDRDDRGGRDGWRDDRGGRGWAGGPRAGLRCESNRGRTAFCPAPVQGNVVLTKQLSHAPCRYGDTWTFDRRGISVRDGCRAEFQFDTRRW